MSLKSLLTGSSEVAPASVQSNDLARKISKRKGVKKEKSSKKRQAPHLGLLIL